MVTGAASSAASAEARRRRFLTSSGRKKRFAERDRQRLAADPSLTPRDSHAILIDRLEKLERAGRSPCYISMQTQSNGSPFGLSIERTTVVADGEVFFDSYGLASSAASWVPDF